MGLRFRKSVTIAPGVRLNFGGKSSSISVGKKGCRFSINTKGKKTVSLGIPGTGVYYSKSFGGSKKKRSYKSDSYSKMDEIKEKLGMGDKLNEEERSALLVEEYENQVELIKGVHKECEEEIVWDEVKFSSEPFDKNGPGPNELQAQQEYDSYEPGLFKKLFGDEKKQELFKAIEAARLEDQEEYEAWEASLKFSDDVLKGDIDAYYEVIEEANPFEDLVDFGSGFEFGTDDPKVMEIEFSVKSDSVVPKKSKSLTKTGKVSEKALSKTAYFDLIQDYVCSCSIRLAREIFALLPVDTVIVHADDSVVNTATGRDEDNTILSVKFTRSGFERVNFDRIDPSDFVSSFEHNMGFKKTAGFTAVDRLI